MSLVFNPFTGQLDYTFGEGDTLQQLRLLSSDVSVVPTLFFDFSATGDAWEIQCNGGLNFIRSAFGTAELQLQTAGEIVLGDSSDTRITNKLFIGSDAAGLGFTAYSDTAGSRLDWNPSTSILSQTIQAGQLQAFSISGTDNVRAAAPSRYVDINLTSSWSGAAYGTATPINALSFVLTDTRSVTSGTIDYVRVADFVVNRSGTKAMSSPFLMANYLSATDTATYSATTPTYTFNAQWLTGNINPTFTGTSATANVDDVYDNISWGMAASAATVTRNFSCVRKTGFSIASGGTNNVNVFDIDHSAFASAGTTNYVGFRYRPAFHSGLASEFAFRADRAGIALYSDNAKIEFGAAIDAAISYDGTDLIINSAQVGSGVVRFNNTTNWTANGTNTVTITNVAPAGVGTATISKWFTVKDDTGTVYYIPAWT